MFVMKEKLLEPHMQDIFFWLSIMDITLEQYQLEILLNFFAEKSNRLIVNKSRQCGLSWLWCLYVIISVHMRPGDTCAIAVSFKASESSLKIKVIKSLYNKIPAQFRKRIVKDNVRELEFQDGSVIHCFGKNHVRGPSSDAFLIMLLDEFAFYGSYADLVYESIQGLWIRAHDGSSLTIVSTPFFENGKYYWIWKDRKTYKNFKRFKICWWNYSGLVIDGMMDEAREKAPLMSTRERVMAYGNDVLVGIYDGMSEQSFAQELEANFTSSIGSYFSFDVMCMLFEDVGCVRFEYESRRSDKEINYCTDFSEIYNRFGQFDMWAAYDVASANGQDFSALTVLAVINNKLRVVYAKKFKEKFESQKLILSDFVERAKPNCLYVEKNGVGMHLSEYLEDTYSGIVKGYTTTQKNKMENFSLIKTYIEKEDLKCPIDKDLQLQFASVRLKNNTNGTVSIEIIRDTLNGGHGDTLMSMVLACRCYKDSLNNGDLAFGRI